MKHAKDNTQQSKRQLPAWVEWVFMVVLGVGIAVLVRTFVMEPYYVPSGSMLSTIHEGDIVVGEKLSLSSREPKQGDVITFKDPENASTTLIKRVIATEGQTVTLSAGHVFVNGVQLSEPYTGSTLTYALDKQSSILSEAISYPYTVPAGYVWVMGDNRTNSLDSRYFGPVKKEAITSYALAIVWPVGDIAGL